MYTLEQLLADASKASSATEGRRSHSQRGADLLVLQETWNVLGRYVMAALEQRRGVNVHGLFRVGWHTTTLWGKQAWRPFVSFNDGFCRAHGLNIRRGSQSSVPDRDLCKMEDFNLSKAAIRYSSQLTKDQVFASLKSLTRQIGTVAGQGRQMSIDTCFGKLVAKDREVDFCFAPELVQGLDAEGGGSARTASAPPVALGATPQAPLQREARSDCAGSLRASQPLAGQLVAGTADDDDVVTIMGLEDAADDCRRGGNLEEESMLRDGTAEVAVPAAPSAISSVRRRQRRLRGSATVSIARHKSAYKAAMERHIVSLEEQVMQTLQQPVAKDGLFSARFSQVDQENAARRQKLHESQHFNLSQFESKYTRHAGSQCTRRDLGPETLDWPPHPERRIKESRHAPAGHALRSDLDSGVSSEEGQRERVAQADALREALQAQIHAKHERRAAEKESDIKYGEEVIEKANNHIERQLQARFEAREREREELSAAWSEQSAVQGIRKELDAADRKGRLAQLLQRGQAGKTKPLLNQLPLRALASARGAPKENEDSAGKRPESARSSQGGGIKGAPGSARGASLGAVAALALQK